MLAPEAAATLEVAILQRIADMLKTSRGQLDRDQPLIALGLGSLELAELKEALERDLGIEVPLSGLIEGWSVREIVESVQEGGALGRSELPDRMASEPKAFERVMNPELGRLLRRLKLDKRYVRSDGCWLFDAEGRAYLDAIAGYGAVPFGHNPSEIWAAIAGVFARSEPAFVQPSSLGAASELAERLLEIAPPGLRYVCFCNSGAETAEVAIKLARAATGRLGILSTIDGFHGKTLGALSATGRSVYQSPFGAPVAGFGTVPYGDVAALEAALFVGTPPAAFIVEPIQGEAGVVEPPPGYLAAARELCSSRGVLLVVDEVQTGLGRTGWMFACEKEGVSPDVLMIAKALGGGIVPMGAVLYGPDAASEAFHLRHSSTFAGYALGARVGIAVLDRLAADGGALLEQVRANGRFLHDNLEELRVAFPKVLRQVRGTGFLIGLQLTDGSDWDETGLLGLFAQRHQLSALVASHLLNVEGVRVAPTILDSRVIRVEPPLVFTEDMCRQLLDAVEKTVEPIARGDTAAAVAHLLSSPRRIQPQPAAVRTARSTRQRRDAGTSRWAFLAHPLDASSYLEFDPGLQPLTAGEIAELTRRLGGLLEPFAAGSARIVSNTGSSTQGLFVVVPRSTEELAAMDRDSARTLIAGAIGVAREAGAEVVGLGGHISVVTGGGLDLGAVGLRLTTGNVYTAITAAQAVAEILAKLDVDMAGATVAVVGAAGSVGRSLAMLLAPKVGRLLLLGNPAHPIRSEAVLRAVAEKAAASLLRVGSLASPGPGRLATLAHRHNGGSSADLTARLLSEELLVVGTDSRRSLPDADLVVTATSSTVPVVGDADLKPGAVVYDLARPSNVAAGVLADRPDVLVVDGGLMMVPEGSDLGWNFGLPAGTAFACMCEPMLLCLEGSLGSATLGVEPPGIGELETMGEWGRLHGFRLAPFQSFGKLITDGDWMRVIAARRAAGRVVGM